LNTRRTTRRLLAGLSTMGIAAGALAYGLASPASAELQTLTVTLLGGQQVSVTVDVPPGTPISQVKLPPLPLPVVSVSWGAPGPGGPTQPGVSVGSTSVPLPSAPSTPPPTGSAPAPGGNTSSNSTSTASSSSSPAAKSGHKGPGSAHQQRQLASSSGTVLPPAPLPVLKPNFHSKTSPTPLRLPTGLPSAANPTLSLFLPGAAQLGVPDFFISNFRIPPFLLPIYQAAGTQYGVPWQVLAAINEIETDYGRDLSTSSAGAVGWMQFLPSSWRTYGVDATGTGIRDPYNPADAIFAAARYLHAAGASSDLRGAIYSYNHANWYVDSVLLRARLIGGMPPQLLSAITGLTQGTFPVHARSKYADDVTEAQVAALQHKPTALVDPAVAHRAGIDIYARAGAPAVAAQDGRIVSMGGDAQSGYSIALRDAFGNTYFYSDLRKLSQLYPVPKPVTETPADIARELASPALHQQSDPAPTGPATAGAQPAQPLAPLAPLVAPAKPTKQRLFAHPYTPGSIVGGALESLAQAAPGLPGYQTFNDYFTQVFGLSRKDVQLEPLRPGAQVIAGTILGRIGTSSTGQAPHVLFSIRPAGQGAPLIDPKPILDGWVLLQRTSLYRAKGANPFVGQAPSIGQVLLESKSQLERQVLADPNVRIYSCGQRDIQAGAIDQRVLAVMEFLSSSGLRPTVSGLRCGHTSSRTAAISPYAVGDAVDFSAFNDVPVSGQDGAGSLAQIAVQRLLTLQGTFQPYQIVSDVKVGSDPIALQRPGYDRVHVVFRPLYGTSPKIDKQYESALKPSQWIKLISRLGQLDTPNVSLAPSSAAIPDGSSGTATSAPPILPAPAPVPTASATPAATPATAPVSAAVTPRAHYLSQ
jgi:Transglycosylase SLT domain